MISLTRRVALNYINKASNIADGVIGTESAGIAPCSPYIETLPQNGHPNTSSGASFTDLQNQMIEDKLKKKNKRKRINNEL